MNAVSLFFSSQLHFLKRTLHLFQSNAVSFFFLHSCISLRGCYICFSHLDFKTISIFGCLVTFPVCASVDRAFCVWFLVSASLLTLFRGPEGWDPR